MPYLTKLIGRFFCWLGLHRWLVESRVVPVTVVERWMWKYHEYDSTVSEPVSRTCLRCNRKEYIYERRWSDISGWREKWATSDELDRVK